MPLNCGASSSTFVTNVVGECKAGFQGDRRGVHGTRKATPPALDFVITSVRANGGPATAEIVVSATLLPNARRVPQKVSFDVA